MDAATHDQAVWLGVIGIIFLFPAVAAEFEKNRTQMQMAFWRTVAVISIIGIASMVPQFLFKFSSVTTGIPYEGLFIKAGVAFDIFYILAGYLIYKFSTSQISKGIGSAILLMSTGLFFVGICYVNLF